VTAHHTVDAIVGLCDAWLAWARAEGRRALDLTHAPFVWSNGALEVLDVPTDPSLSAHAHLQRVGARRDAEAVLSGILSQLVVHVPYLLHPNLSIRTQPEKDSIHLRVGLLINDHPVQEHRTDIHCVWGRTSITLPSLANLLVILSAFPQGTQVWTVGNRPIWSATAEDAAQLWTIFHGCAWSNGSIFLRSPNKEQVVQVAQGVAVPHDLCERLDILRHRDRPTP
jgi:hypothetical protein